MKSWHLIAPNDLKEFDVPEDENPLSADQIKVKIFNVLLNSFDKHVYEGKIRATYPVVPGRFAVGKISELPEDYEGFLEKGKRVFINPNLKDTSFNGDSTPLQGRDPMKSAGVTSDGFLTRYACVPAENLYALPDSVSNENALFIYLIAIAESALDKLGDIKGKYIAVVGATSLGIILCKLLSYYQAIPILIDSRTARLDFARNNGVFYAFLSDDNLDSNVNRVTGAAFADGAIYVSSGSSIVSSVIFRVTAPNSNVVFCRTSSAALQVNLEPAIDKQLHVLGVSDATENIATAINMLATKAVDVSLFEPDICTLETVTDFFAQEDRSNASNEPLAIVDCYGKL